METNKALINDYQKAQSSIEMAIQTIAPIKAITSINDADIVIKSLTAINGLTSLPLCKVFARVKTEKLYQPSYKTFDNWALKVHGLKKASAYKYAKVGEFINDEGNGSILPHSFQDFTYTQLTLITTAFELDKAIELCEDNQITPYMSVKQLEAKIKLLKGKDITAESNVKAVDKPTTPETEQTEQTIEKTTNERKNALKADVEHAVANVLTPEESKQYEQLLNVFKHYAHTPDFQLYIAKYDRKHDRAVYTD